MKYDVFISYSRKDFDEVSALLDIIRKEVPGLSVWFDINGIESGDDFEEKIISSIDNSSYILFALSDNSLASEWTKAEVMYARNTDKKVIPVLLKGAKLKKWFLFKFGTIDCIDSTNAMQMKKLCQNLSNWTGKKPDPAGTDVSQPASEDQSKSDFEVLLDSFLDNKTEEKRTRSRYDVLLNDKGELMLVIKSKEQNPDNPLMIISRTYDSLALLYRCKENAVYFDDLKEEAYSAISKLEKIWVVEISDESVVREYKVPIKIVKDVRVLI